MKSPPDHLYQLLPSIYRQKDQLAGEPLRALMAILQGQLNALEDDMAQLYDNWFIETCQPWVIPYVGDLLGVYGLSDAQSIVPTQRVRVANTLSYRRRKGLKGVLERVIQESTGWYAHAHPYFEQLSMTQHIQHPRLNQGGTIDLRKTTPETLDGPFAQTAHTVDVRSITYTQPGETIAPTRQRVGKFNLPSMGIYLWRLQTYGTTLQAIPAGNRTSSPELEESESEKVANVGYYLHPFQVDCPLFNQPQPLKMYEATTPNNLPIPLLPASLATKQDETPYYGAGRALAIETGQDDPKTDVQVNQIGTVPLKVNGEWPANIDWDQPALKNKSVVVDPVHGRLLFKELQDSPVTVSYTYAFSSDMGGGPYNRGEVLAPLEANDVEQRTVGPQATIDHSTLQAALNAKPIPRTHILISGNELHALDNKTITLPTGGHLTLAAPNFDCAYLTGDLTIEVTPAPTTPANVPTLQLDGIWLKGKITLNQPVNLQLSHTTLVPETDRGNVIEVTAMANDAAPMTITIAHSVMAGWLQLPAQIASLQINDSLIRGCAASAQPELPKPQSVPEDDGIDSPFGPPTTLENVTCLEEIYVQAIPLAKNVIFNRGVTVERRQIGSIRYSYVPAESQDHTPRRFQCHPGATDEATAGALKPAFTGTTYGQPGYGQLSLDCPVEITAGAEFDGEMGAFNHLNQPHRLRNLNDALAEYLGVNFEAGIFYAT